MTKTISLNIKTAGNCDVINITDDVAQAIEQAGISNGIVCVFNVGSTAGITTTEFEPGLANYDLKAAFEKIAPPGDVYEHEKTWHDDNGHAHVQASLLGPSISVPIIDHRCALGTWQQIILIDFDTRARNRTVICQIVGE